MPPDRPAERHTAAIGSIAPEGGPPSPDNYDRLPYPAMPQALSQPQHLAALATCTAWTRRTSPVRACSNLAAPRPATSFRWRRGFPHATFHGVDLAQRHIDEGRRRIAELGLDNISLEQGDLTTLDLGRTGGSTS